MRSWSRGGWAGLLLGLPALAWAHYPLLSAPSWRATKGQEVVFDYAFGHPFEVELAPTRRPAQVLIHPPQGEPVDVTATLELHEEGRPEAGYRFRFTPQQRGDHLVVVRGSSPHGEATLEDHTKLTLNVSGVQVGWDRAVGAPLEILPWTRPYGLPVGVAFRAQTLRDGAPLAGARVELEFRNTAPPPALPPEPLITRVEKSGPDGMFSATLDRAGWWVLSISGERDGEHVRGNLWVWVGA